MIGRTMYVWRLGAVLNSEGGVLAVVERARRAKLAALWIKVAEGQSAYNPNLGGSTGQRFRELIDACHDAGIQVWGWHVPRCPNPQSAAGEASNFGDIVAGLRLDGLIMDAEGGEGFFQGGVDSAEAYASAMRDVKDALGRPLGVSSHDIPQNIAGWLPKFNKIAFVADFNFPQVYYGQSTSVLHRLTRAEDANMHVTLPFVPVGAGWVGPGGGCSSPSACAERAREFIRLIKDRGYQGYSFWHWAGAPAALWEVLNTTAA